MPFPRRPRSAAGLLAGVLALASTALRPAPAAAASPFLVTPDPAVAEASPAYRYANMTNEEALAELDRRQILYQQVAPVPGVRAPIRLTGRLHGVDFHSSLPPEARLTSIFEILDARLALALDDFAEVLERHDIDEVVHYTMYRPNVPPPSSRPHVHAQAAPAAEKPAAEKPAPAAKPAKKPAKKPAPAPRKKPSLGKAEAGSKGEAREEKPSATREKGQPVAPGSAEKVTAPARPAKASAPRKSKRPRPGRGKWAPPGTRHPAGLAIDVGALKKRDGTWLRVAHHFKGHRGERTCGAGARMPEESEARELRAIACEAMDLGIFTYVLTPNYDAAHADHYHMEIKPGVRWFLVH